MRIAIAFALAELAELVAPPARDRAALDERADRGLRGGDAHRVALEGARRREEHGKLPGRPSTERTERVVAGALHRAVREAHARDVAAGRHLLRVGFLALDRCRRRSPRDVRKPGA